MSTITTLNSNDTGPVSRGVINTNFTNLNTDKAELASPTFTGTPTLPTGTIAVTQSAGDNSTKVATTAFVSNTVGFAGCRVYQNAGVVISSTILSFQVENFDTDAFHDNSTNPSRITIPTGKAGKYHFGASVDINSNTECRVKLKLNGTTFLAKNTGGNSANHFGSSVSTIYDLAVGDYIEVEASSSSGAATSSGDAQTNFWAYKIS